MKNIFLLLTCSIILLFACRKEKSNPCDPSLSSNLPVITIDSVYREGLKIVITGNVIQTGESDAGLTHHGVCWSHDFVPSIENGDTIDLGATTNTGRFTFMLDSLPAGFYQFRTFATNCAGIRYSTETKDLMVVIEGMAMVQLHQHYLINEDNSDHIINPDETVQYGFALHNVGTLTAQNIKVTLYTNATQYLTNITPTVFDLGTLNGNGALTAAQNFSFKVAPGTPSGTYCLSMDIEANGKVNTDTLCVEVLQSSSAEFAIVNNGCLAPCTLNFTNMSQGATTYLWDFGDGSTSTEVSPAHLYEKSGNYTVTLTANGPAGNSISTKQVTIGAITFFTSFNSTSLLGAGTYVLELTNGYRIFGYNADLAGNRIVLDTDKQGILNQDSIRQSYGSSYSRMWVKKGDGTFNTMFSDFQELGGFFISSVKNVNELGELINSNNYAEFDHFQISSLYKTIDNNLLALGIHNGSSPSKLELYRMSSNISAPTKIYEDTATYISGAIIFEKSNKYMVMQCSGHSYNSSDIKFQFFSINKDGSGKYDLIIPTDGFNPYTGLNLNNNFYVIGEKNYVGQIRCYSSNGVLLWQKTLSTSSYGVPGNLVLSQDGNLVIVYVGVNDAPVISKISPTGIIIWEKPIIQVSAKNIQGLLEAKDGGFIFTGGATDNRLILGKTDHEGNIN